MTPTLHADHYYVTDEGEEEEYAKSTVVSLKDRSLQ